MEHNEDQSLFNSNQSVATLVVSDEQDSRPGSLSKSAKMTEQPQLSRPSGQKRSSSSSLLSRLLFIRPADSATSSASTQVDDLSPHDADEDADATDEARRVHVAGKEVDAGKDQIVKQRKRKGSLRKAALMGGRKLAGEVRERRNSLLQRTSAKSATQSEHSTQETDSSRDDQPYIAHSLGQDEDDEDYNIDHAPHRNAMEETLLLDKELIGTSAPAITAARLSLLTAHTNGTSKNQQRSTGKKSSDISAAALSSPSDPKSSNSYASTTEDDDDGLSFSRPSTSGISIISSEATYPPPLPTANALSYFPGPNKAIRTRSQHRVRPSPLQHALAPAPEPYSYAETEYWGWVILFVTWLSFTVGMGSCLDIWSWAWDVGETPYAPPELEDDPTLPIVGYYPALIVLTGVVAWVWITVAWIGMKYFRHAKIEV